MYQYDRRLSIHVSDSDVEHSITLQNENLSSFPDVLESLLPVFGSLGFKVSMTTDDTGAVLIVPTELEAEYEDFFEDDSDEFPVEVAEEAADYWDRVVDEASDYFSSWRPKVGDLVRYNGNGTPDEIRGHAGYTGKTLIGKVGVVTEDGKTLNEPHRFLVKFIDWNDGWGEKHNMWWVDDNNLSEAV